MTKNMHGTHLRSCGLLLGVLIASCVLTAAANAQASFVGKSTLLYEVKWAHAVLPAGDYSIRMESTKGPAVIHSIHWNMAVYTEFTNCR